MKVKYWGVIIIIIMLFFKNLSVCALMSVCDGSLLLLFYCDLVSSFKQSNSDETSKIELIKFFLGGFSHKPFYFALIKHENNFI